jgi:prepilin-type processing-associated H-X9-DG protein
MSASAGYAQPAGKSSSNKILGIVAGIGCLVFAVPILAAILFPVFAKVRDKQREMSSASDLRRIGIAMAQYERDHHGKLPSTDTMDQFKTELTPYMGPIGDNDPFVQPGTNKYFLLNTTVSRKKITALVDPANTMVAEEAVPHGGGLTAMLFADGHVHFSQLQLRD